MRGNNYLQKRKFLNFRSQDNQFYDCMYNPTMNNKIITYEIIY